MSEEIMKEVERKIRAAFAEFLDSSLGIERLHAAAERLLEDMEVLNRPPPLLRDLWTELGLMAFGVGCPRKLCEMLHALPQSEVDWLYEHFGDGPGKVIFLEWATRHDMILGWNTTQESTPGGEFMAEVRPKQPLNYVKVDFTLEDK